MSQTRVLQKATEEEGFNLETIALKEGSHHSSKPAAVWISERMDSNAASQMVNGVNKLKQLLDVKIVNKSLNAG